MSNGKGIVVVVGEGSKGREVIKEVWPKAKTVVIRSGDCERSKLGVTSGASLVVLCTDRVSHKVHTALRTLVKASATLRFVTSLSTVNLKTIIEEEEKKNGS